MYELSQDDLNRAEDFTKSAHTPGLPGTLDCGSAGAVEGVIPQVPMHGIAHKSAARQLGEKLASAERDIGTMPMPENWSVLEEHDRKSDHWKLWSGGNDWEASATTNAIEEYSPWRGPESSRVVWYETNFKDKFGDTPKDDSVTERARGDWAEKGRNTWVRLVNKQLAAKHKVDVNTKGPRSIADIAAWVLKSKEMEPYVSKWGIDTFKPAPAHETYDMYDEAEKKAQKSPTTQTNTPPINTPKFYRALANAETGGQPSSFIRTKVQPTGGSTAYGPVQLTGSTVKDFLKRYNTGFKPAVSNYLTRMVSQAGKFNQYGNATNQPGYNAKYDYGGAGDMGANVNDRAMYRRSVGRILEKMQGELKTKGNLSVDSLLKRWRGKTPSRSYRRRFDKVYNKSSAYDLGKQLAKARKETDTDPTEAQIEAGNYRKGKVQVHGLTISIENPKGSTRSGTDPDGNEWSITMKGSDYGYFGGQKKGADGEQIDCFLGPKPELDYVFVVDQVDPNTKKFDEHKILLGFQDKASARKGYLANYEKGWKGCGAITKMGIDEFKEWLKKDPTKPVAKKSYYRKADRSSENRQPISYNRRSPSPKKRQYSGQRPRRPMGQNDSIFGLKTPHVKLTPSTKGLWVKAPNGVIKGKVLAEIANTPQTRMRGLSKRSHLESGYGMLFDCAGGFWMKDVDFPLDIVFMDKSGSVLEWQRMDTVAPGNRPKTYYPESKEAALALELPAGWCEEYGVEAGDKLVRAPATVAKSATAGKRWTGCDLDGSLAKYTKWEGATEIGEPIPKMVSRVKRWLSDGKAVKIMTARVADDKDGKIKRAIGDWCEKHIGQRLPVTNEKDQYMEELWDDRAIQLKKNTGEKA